MAKSADWQAKLEEFFMKFPALPKNAREVLVSVTPWFALIFGILGVVIGLLGLGALSLFSPLMVLGGGFGHASGSLISVLIATIASALLLAAFFGTKDHKKQGWDMLFWSEVASVVSSVLYLSPVGVLVALFSFYLLYQIKSYYK
ncbi:MAG TPA: hypothetical protein VF189_01775 [Patescibacteria group bacterium]